MTLYARVSACIAIIALTACSVLPKAETPDVYRLPATPLPHAQAATTGWSLRVNTPQAERMIDSSRIAVVPQGDQISVYKGARWSDTATTLLRNRLIDAFRDDGRASPVSSDDNALPTNYTLAGDLRAFQSEYQGSEPVVIIRFDARLVQNKGLRVVATHRFDIAQPVGGKTVPQVVAAFGRASDTLASQIVAWTMQQSLASPAAPTD